MRKLILSISFLVSITIIYAQDTILYMDGTIEIVNNLLLDAESGLTDKVQELNFIDFENNPIIVSPNNSNGIVINVWATWCKPCIAEIQTFNELYEEYKDCKIDFYALSYIEDSAGTAKYLDTHKYNFKQIMATREYIQNNKLVSGLPSTLFIDKDGNVLFKIVGGSPEPENQIKTINKFKKGLEAIGCNH